MTARFEKRVLLSAPVVTGREMKYIERAFLDDWIVPLGPNVNEFEKNVVNYLGLENVYAVAMSSGTAAIHIALRLLNVLPGEEIFCSSATFVATANPILYEKAVPVFIDSENETYNICPDSLLKAIQNKKKTGKIPRILIAVDLFGTSANYERICKICNDHDIKLIEDSAESFGSTYRNQKCGTFGNFGILSFNGNKIITTSGGGMLICHSKKDADKALFYITQARDQASYYLHSEVGYNYRMSNICAGVGLGQLETLDQRVQARRSNFDFYAQYFKNSDLHFKAPSDEHESNHWLSVGVINDQCQTTPAALINHLNKYNVEARQVWKPLHTQPLFKDTEFFHIETIPVAEKIFDRGICLPSSSNLAEDTLRKVCELIKIAL